MLVHRLIEARARVAPVAVALRQGARAVSYGELAAAVDACAAGLATEGLGAGDRVAVWLEKRVEAVVALFAASAAGGAFVPVNPLLRARQALHVLADSGARVLVTAAERFRTIAAHLHECPDLRTIVLVDGAAQPAPAHGICVMGWHGLQAGAAPALPTADEDALAAILYTSGSTGRPKGVMLSHRNLLLGADSVCRFLGNTADDRILSVLPFSFDYGLNQLTTAFRVGASVTLLNYLLPSDVVRAVERDAITGLGGIPPLWRRLAEIEWPEAARASLRYATNSGGAMPLAVLRRLRARLPTTHVVLMYGLTEAFRSTFLDPAELDRRPDSIGKPIPHAELLVVHASGRQAAVGEEGELVHRGPLVAQGYWRDPERTAERFRPPPPWADRVAEGERAVWSGDTVRRDAEGFLYFVGRRDEMIKVSGYRISPTEIEEVLYASGLIGEAVAFGVPHPEFGQGIVVVASPPAGATSLDVAALAAFCRRELPPYMVPHRILGQPALPLTPTGKFDRSRLAAEYATAFAGPANA